MVVVVGLENRSELRMKSEMLARVPLYLLTLPSLRLQQGSTPSSRLFGKALRLSPYAKEIVMLICFLEFWRKTLIHCSMFLFSPNGLIMTIQK